MFLGTLSVSNVGTLPALVCRFLDLGDGASILTRRFSFVVTIGAREGGEVMGGRELTLGGMALPLSEEGVAVGLEGDIGRVAFEAALVGRGP